MKGNLGERRVRILVVDPEDWCRDFLTSVMRLCGLQEFKMVASAAEALAALEESAFDLLIADHHLAEQQRLLESFRHRNPSMRFIVMLQRGYGGFGQFWIAQDIPDARHSASCADERNSS